MGRLRLFLPLLVFTVLAVFLWRGLSLDPNYMPSALVDRPLPSFSLPTLDGREVTADELLGEVAFEQAETGVGPLRCRVQELAEGRLSGHVALESPR